MRDVAHLADLLCGHRCYGVLGKHLKGSHHWLEKAFDSSGKHDVRLVALEELDLEPLWVRLAEICSTTGGRLKLGGLCGAAPAPISTMGQFGHRGLHAGNWACHLPVKHISNFGGPVF